MLKTRLLMKLVLLGGLVLGASALMSATATARPSPEYTLCAKVGVGELFTYTSRWKCLLDAAEPGEVPSGGEGWVHARPISAIELLLCVDNHGGFSGGLCTLLGAGYGSEIQKFTVKPLEGKNKGISTLKGHVLTEEAIVSCVTNKFKILPEKSGKASNGKITYSGCTAIKPAKCEVNEPIVAEFSGQLEEPTSGSLTYVDTFTGTGSTDKEFVKIVFKNKGTEKCGQAEEYPVTGSQTCTFGPNVEMMSTTQEVICEASGSNLKLGGKTATYTGIDIVESTEGELGNVELGGEHLENSTKQ